MSKGNTKGRGSKSGPKQSPAKPAGAASVGTSSTGTGGAPASGKPTSKSTGRRKKRGINWILVTAAIGGAALLGLLIYNIARETQVIAGVQTYGPFPANMHVDGDVTYAQRPPVGGEHRATWQNCGIYNREIAEELAVHSMEHGAVWITYRPDLPADQIEGLKGLVRGKNYTLLSPYQEQPSPVMASAWGVQLTAENASDPRLGQFLAKYRQGSQTPEPGAPCVGGQGAPDER